jgi:hypothetical protein
VQNTDTATTQAHIHAPSGIRTPAPSVQAEEDIACLRPRDSYTIKLNQVRDAREPFNPTTFFPATRNSVRLGYIESNEVTPVESVQIVTYWAKQIGLVHCMKVYETFQTFAFEYMN